MISISRSVPILIFGFLCGLAIWLSLASQPVHAQSASCDPAITAFNESVSQRVCRQVRPGNVCYGARTVDSVLKRGAGSFNRPGRQVAITDLESLTTRGPRGAAVMVARTATGNVKIIAYGGVGLEPLSGQEYVVRKQGSQLICEQTPPGLLLQTATGRRGTVIINGVEIKLGSTAFVSVEGDLLYDQDPRIGGRSDGYSTVRDESNAISINVPATWEEVESSAGEYLLVGSDLSQWDTFFGQAPGAWVEVTDGWESTDDLLDSGFDLSDDCSFDDRYGYAGGNLIGAYDLWLDCGGEPGRQDLVLAAESANPEIPMILFLLNLPADTDLSSSAIDEILYSLAVPGAPEEGYATISDGENAFSVSVPDSWSDVEGAEGEYLAAAPNLLDWEWFFGDAPGILVELLENPGAPEDVLDNLDSDFGLSSDCIFNGRYDYVTDELIGAYDIWLDCGDVPGRQDVTFAADIFDPDGPNTIIAILKLPTANELDLAAIGQILNSLAVPGTVEAAGDFEGLGCGFDSDCEFGDDSCELNSQVARGPYCGDSPNSYTLPGLYSVSLYGNGRVRIDAANDGRSDSQLSLTQVDFNLDLIEPSTYAFCWAGNESENAGWETAVTARSTDVSVDRIAIEYLGNDCATAGDVETGAGVMTVANIEGEVEVSALGEVMRPEPGEKVLVGMDDSQPNWIDEPQPGGMVVDSSVIQTITFDPEGLPNVDSGDDDPETPPTDTPTPRPEAPPTDTPTPKPEAPPTDTPTPTATPTATPTPTLTPTSTNTPPPLDSQGPEIVDVEVYPPDGYDVICSSSGLEVDAYISDPSGVAQAYLWYQQTYSDYVGDWQQVDLFQVDGDYYAVSLTDIDSFSVEFVVVAEDRLGNVTEYALGVLDLPPCDSAECNYDADDLFFSLWEGYSDLIGCPVSDRYTISTIAEEWFEGGHMFWRKDLDEMYAIYDRDRETGDNLFWGNWDTDLNWVWDESYPDAYPEGIGLSPPPGLVEPVLGFGWVWRNFLNQEYGPLGWALDKEYGFDNVGQVQEFEGGLIFKGSDPKIYLLLDDGSFYAGY